MLDFKWRSYIFIFLAFILGTAPSWINGIFTLYENIKGEELDLSVINPYWFLVTIPLALLLLGFVFWEAAKRAQISRDLRRLKATGVRIRNAGAELTQFGELQQWINQYKNWDKSVIKVLERKSHLTASEFETLNRMPPLSDIYSLNFDHLHYLTIFEEKLHRLENIILRLDSRG